MDNGALLKLSTVQKHAVKSTDENSGLRLIHNWLISKPCAILTQVVDFFFNFHSPRRSAFLKKKCNSKGFAEKNKLRFEWSEDNCVPRTRAGCACVKHPCPIITRTFAIRTWSQNVLRLSLKVSCRQKHKWDVPKSQRKQKYISTILEGQSQLPPRFSSGSWYIEGSVDADNRQFEHQTLTQTQMLITCEFSLP